MAKKNYKTPGVYVEEVSAFPTSVAQVETAIPAFIGYTPQTKHNGNDCAFIPTKITSFSEFESIFCFPITSKQKQQYSPQYYLVHQSSKPKTGDYLLIGSEYYAILPDAHTIYYMYNSVKLFYQNGGGNAYIVSVGGYGKNSRAPLQIGDPLVNPNIQLSDLLKGLATLKKEKEPTMYVCPEATLLSIAENGGLMQQMLLQNNQMRTAISILDIIGGNQENPLGNNTAIEAFRNHTGTTGLPFGTAYFPFVGTSLMSKQDINYTNLFGGNIRALVKVLSRVGTSEEDAVNYLKSLLNTETSNSLSKNHRTLLTISSVYDTIISAVLKVANTIPASGGMAGVITMVDNSRGVWKAPANVSVAGVTSLPIKIDNTEQEGLNVDAISGKSINAIRSFPGKGVLVWGARTLAGNDNEWRYVNVRRTAIMIEQSCKKASYKLVFEPNDANTWLRINTMIENFLYDLFRKGAFAGSKKEDAYFVKCGLGTTMTQNDIANGKLIVNIGFAPLKPAEFIILKFSQQQVTST